MVEKCTLDEKVKAFFMLRFNKRFDQDPEYFAEWRKRFLTENPEAYMDKTSLAVYKIIKEACK